MTQTLQTGTCYNVPKEVKAYKSFISNKTTEIIGTQSSQSDLKARLDKQTNNVTIIHIQHDTNS